MRAAEVVVIGAGVVGSATAYELARRGVSVTLIERVKPGYGASGRNPGYLWSHTRAEGSQLELGLAGRARYDALVEELDDFEFRSCGGMIYFFEHQEALFPAFVANRRGAGIPMELLDAAEARACCPILPEDIGGATWNPLDAHVNPERLVDALTAAAKRHGAKVRADARDVELDIAGGRCRGVLIAGEGVPADAIVVAAGAWSPRLLEPHGLPLPIEPMRLQMVETEPIDARFEPVLYGPTGVKQYALTKDLDGYAEDDFTHPLETILSGVELLELAAQRRNGRVLMGCPMDFAGLDDRPTVGGIGLTLGVLGDHLPALSGVAVERVWGGLLPQTPDALPVLGPVRDVDGLILATGHVFGMLAGPISGLLVAQTIVGEPTELDLAPFRYEREVISGTPERQELRQW